MFDNDLGHWGPLPQEWAAVGVEEDILDIVAAGGDVCVGDGGETFVVLYIR